MHGSNKYARLFKTGQYEKLYLVSGQHARGVTFYIQILPEGEIARSNGNNNLCVNEDAVTVYGVISGQLGWSERYGWIHEGPWMDDFEKLVKKAEFDKEEKENERKTLLNYQIEKEQKRIKDLLDAY